MPVVEQPRAPEIPADAFFIAVTYDRSERSTRWTINGLGGRNMRSLTEAMASWEELSPEGALRPGQPVVLVLARDTPVRVLQRIVATLGQDNPLYLMVSVPNQAADHYLATSKAPAWLREQAQSRPADPSESTRLAVEAAYRVSATCEPVADMLGSAAGADASDKTRWILDNNLAAASKCACLLLDVDAYELAMMWGLGYLNRRHGAIPLRLTADPSAPALTLGKRANVSDMVELLAKLPAVEQPRQLVAE